MQLTLLLLLGYLTHQTLSSNPIYLGSKKVQNGKEFVDTDYYVSASSAIWSSAYQDCRQILGADAHLLSIETEDENDFLLKWLQSAGATFGYYWTSGQYDLNQGIWRWGANPDADFDSYTNWAVGEPSSTGPVKRVVFNFLNQFSSNWAVRDDTFLTRYICEVPHNATNPTSPIPTSTTPIPTSTSPESTTPGGIIIPDPCPIPISLTIVLDASIGMENDFVIAKIFAAALAIPFTNTTVGSKLGVVTFARGSYNVVKFGPIPDMEDVNTNIMEANLNYEPQRMTHAGMNYSMIFQQTLSGGLPMRMVVITNGLSDFPALTRDVATTANFMGIRTYAVGIEPRADDAELLNIAFGVSSRVCKDTSGNHLLNLKPLVNSICVGF